VGLEVGIGGGCEVGLGGSAAGEAPEEAER